jgi:hypothetical protein
VQDLSSFIKLPGELRNQIYDLVFLSARPIKSPTDTIILFNDLERRRLMQRFRSKNYKVDKTTKTFAEPYCMINKTPATITQFSKPVVGLAPVFETSLLRVCQQTYQEAVHLFYRSVTFAYYLSVYSYAHSRAIEISVDLSRIYQLRLELQCGPNFGTNYTNVWDILHELFASMTNLKRLQLVITFSDKLSAPTSVANFNSEWRTGNDSRDYSKLMRKILRNIPKGVEVNVRVDTEVSRHGKLWRDCAC